MPRLLSGSGILTREARSLTWTSIQPMRASTARMMSHLTALGSFFIIYFLILLGFWVSGAAAAAGTGQQLRCLRSRQGMDPAGTGNCPGAIAARLGKGCQVRIRAVIPGLPNGSPAQPFCPRGATAAPDRRCPPGSRRRNRSPRRQIPARRLSPRGP